MGKPTNFEKWWQSVQSWNIESRYIAAGYAWHASWWHWAKQAFYMGIPAGFAVGVFVGWLIWRG